MKRILVILAMLIAINANAQWELDVRLTNNPLSSSTSINNARSVASSGSVVHVVWRDYLGGNAEIYYKRSTDSGVSWEAETRLTNNSGASTYPCVAVLGSIVHVVWQDDRDGNYEIYYKRSTDAGISWGVDIRQTNNNEWSYQPSVAVFNSIVHLVWFDSRNGPSNIYYKRSSDSGVSWGTDTCLADSSASVWIPTVAVSGQVVFVVWYDLRDGNAEIYYKRSTDGGVSWGTDTRLTNNTGSSGAPSVSITGSIIRVVWNDTRDGNYEIYFKQSTDEGLSWGADTRLTNNNADSWYPSVEVSGSVVYVVWEDKRDGNSEIYYKRSTNGGANWETDTRLTNNTASSELPSLAVSGSIVHVVWRDNRDGNYEIYYKRNPTGNPTGIQNISTETPSKYSLSQNYPNPFNSTSNLKFQIVNTGNVKLIVYDIMGKEVQTLVNERLQPGTYEATLDASALNSGVYFYKLTVGTFAETKKMLLIK